MSYSSKNAPEASRPYTQFACSAGVVMFGSRIQPPLERPMSGFPLRHCMCQIFGQSVRIFVKNDLAITPKTLNPSGFGSFPSQGSWPASAWRCCWIPWHGVGTGSGMSKSSVLSQVTCHIQFVFPVSLVDSQRTPSVPQTHQYPYASNKPVPAGGNIPRTQLEEREETIFHNATASRIQRTPNFQE